MAPGIMCFGKKPEDPDARRNEEIEKVIRNDRKRQQREVKLLLLGTPLIAPLHRQPFADQACF
jgi:guanine nucleotide-binding protein subunit alpha, other